ncbi:hypothetical protein Q5762_08530 [Streptomyces sp. P9(2023)]|uniref:hypothetical protein n=1 Tax=Streptomyces sp. P9(2023) TaxID=3064394 RepID=UPI0028F3EF52|nr:hypothetical protein [Streptomyces sp. P9(2023)]MDT9688401.1 hypothetical protein [Streptomyces sp. P9(2023)]
MRLTKTLATGAVALTALVTLTGCGSDDPMEDSGLPKADSMAALQQLINERGAQCNELEPTGDEAKYMLEEAKDPAWGIKERAVCQDAQGDDMVLLLISDMTKLQEANVKAVAKDDGKDLIVGQNFAVVPVGDDTGRALMQSGLLALTCDPKNREDIPSGFTVTESQVKGCFTTNYIPS